MIRHDEAIARKRADRLQKGLLLAAVVAGAIWIAGETAKSISGNLHRSAAAITEATR